MPFGLISGAIGVASGLKGLFGKKEKSPSVQDNLLAQAAGARAAADKYGFNPLTMLQYGNTAGTGLAPAAGPPPLASVEVLLGGLDQFDPQVKADRERQRQADQLNLDLAKLKLEQARSGVAMLPMVAADSVGGGSPLGRKAVTVYPGGGDNAQSASLRLPTFASAIRGGVPDGSPVPVGDRDPVAVSGLGWQVSDRWSPAQVVEDEYAELISLPYGVAKLGADFGRNVFWPWYYERKEQRQRKESAAQDLDDLARNSDKPRTRTTDWERKYRSRWLHN